MQNRLKSHSLGYPRIGAHRELKKALEAYWAGTIGEDQLRETAFAIRKAGWQRHAQAGIDLIPSNDFSLYDHILDATTTFGATPERFLKAGRNPLDTYFAMARGAEGIPACAMTKWFDTNYHYIVPELKRDTAFRLSSGKALDEYREAKSLGIQTVPVIVGPVTYLSLAACADAKFDTLELLPRLLPVYDELLGKLRDAGAEYVQLDEPIFSTDLSESQKAGLRSAYERLASKASGLKIIVANYFGRLGGNLPLFASLPVAVLHVDAVRAPEEVSTLANAVGGDTVLSVGVVEGRNIWKTDLRTARKALGDAAKIIGRDRVWVATSCSLLHVPVTLQNEKALHPELRARLAFAEEKLDELHTLADGYKADEAPLPRSMPDVVVKERLAEVAEKDFCRGTPRKERLAIQRRSLGLPLLPTTTIGSFPQTKEVRANRAKWKRGEISTEEYEQFLESSIANCVRFQDDIGLDVLVHGEFERNDMVEYFGEHMKGIAFTENGWVQSYGSRCVKPPVIHADVSRECPITVRWTRQAQSQTKKPVKGMLTGPVTILKWSFVRNDQPLRDTAFQIALALRDEVHDLEEAGTRIIQIDEPGLREGLPLRSSDAAAYLEWAVDAFRLASSGVCDETQIHTHMCYARFDGIIEAVSRLDADVISIEAARSPLERLAVFGSANYGGEVGPGVWDIHSPRVPPVSEMVGKLLEDAGAVGAGRLWANPDCGLKTRSWTEVSAALKNLVEAAALARARLA